MSQNNYKRCRKFAQKRLPGLWEWLASCGWLLRLYLRPVEPLLLRQSRKIAASTVPQTASSPKKILFFQTRSNPPHLAWAGTLATALKARGHDIRFLGCSRELATSCNNANYPEGLPMTRCRTCYLYTKQYFNAAGFDADWLRQFVDDGKRALATELIDALVPSQYEEFQYMGFPLGKLVRHSVGHYLRTGSIGSDPTSNDIYRQFLINSVLVSEACAQLLDAYSPDIVTMLGGLFMPEHVMMSMAQARGKRVVVYEIGMLALDALMIQHDRPTDYDDRESWERFKDRPLTAEEGRTLDEYLVARSTGQRSIVNYWERQEDDVRVICESLGIDPYKRTAVLFPNITWDSALFEKHVAFAGMFDWIDRTIEYFTAHPKFQLIIRAHPAESLLPGSLRESVAAYIARTHPDLPKNILVVPSDMPVSSYRLMDLSQCGLVYASSTGMELGVRGIPTLVAGEVHFRRKGFTVDIEDVCAYARQLDAVMSGNAPLRREDIIESARRYAYFSFFRTSMPFGKVHAGEGEQPVLTFDRADDLLPGKDRSLDIICNGIVSGTPFIYE